MDAKDTLGQKISQLAGAIAGGILSTAWPSIESAPARLDASYLAATGTRHHVSSWNAN